MGSYSTMPMLNCGKVYNVDLPSQLTKNDPPIDLAKVEVSIDNIKDPCVIINYSQNIQFSFSDFNPNLRVVYRLIRKTEHPGSIRVLEQWNYRVSEVIPTIVEKVDTIEPLVLNFCDCLANTCETSFTYILQLTELINDNTNFNITRQEISGIAIRGT